MYKILLLVRESDVKPLWTAYMEEQEVEVTPAVTDPLTGDVITPAVTEQRMGEYATDDLDVIEEKVKELLAKYTCSQIRVVKDMNYTLDILFA